MRLDEPAWWYVQQDTAAARVLRPLGRLYGWAAARRFARASAYRSALPVICVGNFTAGGTGKTPTALYVAKHLASRGERPAFLTRGYGGCEKGPFWVDAGADNADRTGDEALLLARHCPTLIARDRRAGARAIEADDMALSAIIMDDGLQNPSLAKDLTLAIVDGTRGLGNGEVMPAGPLRAPLAFQLALADAVIINQPAAPGRAATAPGRADQCGPGHDGPSDWSRWFQSNFTGPVLSAVTRPVGDTSWLRGANVVAFAGIGAPSRFFTLLAHLGARLAATRTFPDHHAFNERDAAGLIAEADRRGGQLVTTEKDLVRIGGHGAALDALKARARPLAIELCFAGRDESRFAALLETALKAKRKGKPNTNEPNIGPLP